MHAGTRAFTIETAGSLETVAETETPMGEPPDLGGVTWTRAASFTATSTLQQGACVSAPLEAPPPLTQHACEGSEAEAQRSAARAGRAAPPKSALTTMAAASRRIGSILLGSCSGDNPKRLLHHQNAGNHVHAADVPDLARLSWGELDRHGLVQRELLAHAGIRDDDPLRGVRTVGCTPRAPRA
jgi:hypothetical protein